MQIRSLVIYVCVYVCVLNFVQAETICVKAWSVITTIYTHQISSMIPSRLYDLISRVAINTYTDEKYWCVLNNLIKIYFPSRNKSRDQFTFHWSNQSWSKDKKTDRMANASITDNGEGRMFFLLLGKNMPSAFLDFLFVRFYFRFGLGRCSDLIEFELWDNTE